MSDRRSFLKLVGGTALVASLPAVAFKKPVPVPVLVRPEVQGAHVAAVYADYRAQLDTISRARAFLDLQRDYVIRHERNEEARNNALVQIHIGYANLEREQKLVELKAHARLQRATEPS